MNRFPALVGFLLFALVAAPAMGQESTPPYTLGDLALRLSEELGFQLEEPDAALARTALATWGIRIGTDLSLPLVERDAVAIFNQLGLNLATSNETRPVTEEKVEMLLKLVDQSDLEDSRNP